MDALDHRSAGIDPLSVRGFLTAAADPDAEITSHEGVGLGTDVIVTSASVVANALTWEGGVVHLAVFPAIENSAAPSARRSGSRRIDRPSTPPRMKRGRWFHE
jgi:hypothetical protein